MAALVSLTVKIYRDSEALEESLNRHLNMIVKLHISTVYLGFSFFRQQ